ncbi:MAG: DEAD/DEAH box helicase [Flavisolibacter sp.]
MTQEANTENKEKKVVMLFLPGALQKNYGVLQILQIQKQGKDIGYTVSDINRKELRHFVNLPEIAYSFLLGFQQEQIALQVKETEARYKKQKAGIALSVFMNQALLRYLHQQFTVLYPYLQTIRWYHRIPKSGTQNFQTLPCWFGVERPQLQFEVIRQGEGLSLAILIKIGSQLSPISDFSLHVYFLQKDNNYFLLSFRDYQTLEWLRENFPEGDGLPPTIFTEKVLAKIEKDYPVNRNHLLDEKKIETIPACRVLLSELNNSFLLLTPQWLYDGILVEGPWKEIKEASIRGERVLITRDRETETSFRELLSSFHANFPGQTNGYYYLSFAEAQKKQWFIKTYYRLLEMNIEIAGMDLLQHFRYSPHQVETSLSILEEKGSSMLLRMIVHFGKETVSLTTVQKALYAGQRAIVLKDGSLGILSEAWLEKYALMIKHGRLQDGGIEVSKWLGWNEGVQGEDPAVVRADVKAEWWDRWKRWQMEEASLLGLPASVKAVLRPYQQKGFEWLTLLSQIGAGGCLADDMGLGKTLQTICFLAWYSERNPDTRHIIVCPTSLMYNWQGELQKFAPGWKTEIFHGSARQLSEEGATVVITSYGMLRSNSDLLLSRSYGIAVIDESHNIKNPSAQITRVTHQLQAAVRIALSGTPVVNNTFDLYAQLSFVLPGLFGTREFFKREYADPIDRWGDEAKIKTLQRLTGPFILRRTKEQVATDLPAKTEAVLWCTLGPSQEELYNEIRDQVRSNLFLGIKTNGLGKSKLAVLQGLLKLRQICNHPGLLSQEEHAGRLDSAKMEVLFSELANVLERHRVLVFSQFSSMLQLLAKECDQKGHSYFLLDGQTPAVKRRDMVAEFQENPQGPKLFLISLKAGNTGLTLTAADYVFLFDPWWNTAVEQQAVDRTHRIGQTKKVFSYKLVCKNTIEEKILELQQRKKHLAEELIGAEEDFVKNLGEEDIAYLFG